MGQQIEKLQNVSEMKRNINMYKHYKLRLDKMQKLAIKYSIPIIIAKQTNE